MTVEEAMELHMTMGERLARLIPTEIENPKTPGGGYSQQRANEGWRFTCSQCKKEVQTPIRTSYKEWAYKATYLKRKYLFCSYSCMRAWEAALKEKKRRDRLDRRNHNSWSQEDDWLIWHLYYDEGLTQDKIGARLSPQRSGNAVGKRLDELRAKRNARPPWMQEGGTAP